MLELVVGPENGVIKNASIPVTWCLDKETLAKLSELKKPQILFELEYDDGYTKDRFLEKLSNYMAYVPCRRPGKVKISAYIVSSTTTLRSQNTVLKKVFLKKDGSYFDYSVDDKTLDFEYHYDTSEQQNDYAIVHEHTESPYTVTIPKDVFGKELPPWFKFAVNRYLENTTFDQCHQRQRIISLFMFRMYPLMIETLFWELRMLGIYFISFMLGTYHINMSRLFRPFKDGRIKPSVIIAQDLKSKCIIDILYEYFKKTAAELKFGYGTQKIIAGWTSAVFIPTVPLAFLVYTLIGLYFLQPYAYNPLILIVLPFIVNIILVLILAAVVALCIGGLALLAIIWDAISMPSFNIDFGFFDFCDRVAIKLLKFEMWVYSWFDTKEDLKVELLTCNGDASSVVADIKRIPLKERSISLIFSDIKNHVCKPMAR